MSLYFFECTLILIVWCLIINLDRFDSQVSISDSDNENNAEKINPETEVRSKIIEKVRKSSKSDSKPKKKETAEKPAKVI